MPPEKERKDEWFKDMFRYGQAFQFGLFIFLAVLVLSVLLFTSLRKRETLSEARQVVIYTSQDQVYAEPILRDFEKESGIKVRAVYDSEAVKTVGLANRLLAEQNHPQCDVFWSNEELRTRQLAARNVFRETNGWTPVGHRSRRIVVNTNKIPAAAAPRSMQELTNALWRGKIALAYPLFGTTATHFLALREHWGEAHWLEWCRALAANQPFLVDGNSVATRLVGRGEAWLGLTDSDDIAAEAREGAPIAALPLNPEMLLIPNTIAVIRGAPHPEPAQRLFDYLRRPDVVQRLVEQNALEPAGTEEPATLRPDWSRVLQDLDPATTSLQRIFLR